MTSDIPLPIPPHSPSPPLPIYERMGYASRFQALNAKKQTTGMRALLGRLVELIKLEAQFLFA